MKTHRNTTLSRGRTSWFSSKGDTTTYFHWSNGKQHWPAERGLLCLGSSSARKVAGNTIKSVFLFIQATLPMPGMSSQEFQIDRDISWFKYPTFYLCLHYALLQRFSAGSLLGGGGHVSFCLINLKQYFF